MMFSRAAVEALLDASIAAANRTGQLSSLVWRMAAEGRNVSPATARRAEIAQANAARLREHVSDIRAELEKIEAICAQADQDGQNQ